jgi:hypothetical protein
MANRDWPSLFRVAKAMEKVCRKKQAWRKIGAPPHPASASPEEPSVGNISVRNVRNLPLYNF